MRIEQTLCSLSRDHGELMTRVFGANVELDNHRVENSQSALIRKANAVSRIIESLRRYLKIQLLT